MALDILVRKIQNIERNPSCVEQAFKGRRGHWGWHDGCKKALIQKLQAAFSSLNDLILGNEFKGEKRDSVIKRLGWKSKMA